MIKMKPVWRMNAWRGVPSDFQVNGKVLTTRGQVKLLECSDWDRKSAYQTNRTKAAKFHKVDCFACRGSGKALAVYESHKACPDCKGHGHTWERIA